MHYKSALLLVSGQLRLSPNALQMNPSKGPKIRLYSNYCTGKAL